MNTLFEVPAERVAIDSISGGARVICEANEFGRSRFFDAIHAVVFKKHTATGKSIQSLPANAFPSLSGRRGCD